MNLNNQLNKIKCYSFGKQDFILLLSVYNAVYLLLSSILKSHFIACFVTAFLLSLVALFVIVWINLIKVANKEETELEQEQGRIRKNFRDEYLRVHNMKRKNELLQLETDIVVDHAAPTISLNKDFKEIKEVHFNYIGPTPSKKINGQPEGT